MITVLCSGNLRPTGTEGRRSNIMTKALIPCPMCGKMVPFQWEAQIVKVMRGPGYAFRGAVISGSITLLHECRWLDKGRGKGVDLEGVADATH